MWRSRLISASKLPIRKPSLFISSSDSTQFHSKVNKSQTLIGSYDFKSNTIIRFFSSTLPDSLPNNNNNNNNDDVTLDEMWKVGLQENLDIFDSDTIEKNNDNNSSTTSVINEMWTQGVVNDEVSNNVFDVIESKGNEEFMEVDSEDVERVVWILKFEDGEFNAVKMESSLDEMSLNLSEEFVAKVLESRDVGAESLVAFYKWAMGGGDRNGEGFKVSTRSLDLIVKAVCKELKKTVAYKLWDLVKEIGEKDKGVVSTEMLNELISLFSRLGKGMAGYEVFSKFGELSCVMNADSYYFTIDALCRRGIFERVGLVCEKMVSEGKLPEARKVGDVICLLCKGGMVKEAHKVYLLAKEKKTYLPQSSVNFLISSLCDRKKNDVDSVHLALKILDDFTDGEKQKYAIKQFSCVIQGLCRINDIEGAKGLLSKMIDAGPPPGNTVFNTIINGLCKAGDIAGAIKIMRMMEDRGLKPDVFAYTVIMSGYSKGGEMEEAAKMLAEAKKNHCKLTPVTYHTMIRGYCNLENFGKAVKLLEEMEEFGVQPNSDEYNKLIQSLCLKVADWGKAEKLMEQMTRKGLYLNGITKSLVRAVKELEEEAAETKEASVEA